jgi:hypothetical protein
MGWITSVGCFFSSRIAHYGNAQFPARKGKLINNRLSIGEWSWQNLGIIIHSLGLSSLLASSFRTLLCLILNPVVVLGAHPAPGGLGSAH